MSEDEITTISILTSVKKRLVRLRDNPDTPRVYTTSWSALLSAMLDECEK